MATNNPRRGYERKRSQLKTKTMGQKHWTKRCLPAYSQKQAQGAGDHQSKKCNAMRAGRDLSSADMNAFLVPLLFGLARDRWRSRVFDLQPTDGATGAIRRAEAL